MLLKNCHPWLFLGVVIRRLAFSEEELQDGWKAITPFKQSQSPDLSELKSRIHLKFPTPAPIVLLGGHSWVPPIHCIQHSSLHSDWEKPEMRKGWQFIHLNHSPESSIFNKVFRHSLKKLLKRQNTRGFKVNSTT